MAPTTAPTKAPQRTRRHAQAVHSYLLRVVENRVVTVTLAFELHDIGSGVCRRFESLEAMQQFLARRRRAR